MKDLKDGELIDMAHNEIKKMDTHFWAQMILCVLCLVESTLLFFGLIPIIVFAFFWLLFIGLYQFHTKKLKKSEKKIEEILYELNNRV